MTRPPPSWLRVRSSNRAKAGVIALVIGLGLLGHGLWETGLQLSLRFVGEPAMATVEHVFRGRAGEQTRLRLAYVANGSVRAATVASRASAWQPGETASLRYLPFAPGMAMLEDRVRSSRALLESGALGGIGLMLTPLGLWLYLGFRRRARLAAGRTPFRESDGRSIGLVTRPYMIGGYQPQALLYAFYAADGRLYRGRSPDLPKGCDAPDSGPVRVRYRRTDPRISIPVAW